MKRLSEIPASKDPRMPLADVTNAPYLFGDPFGDVDDDEDGDPSDIYGDVDTLSQFQLVAGDPRTKFGRFVSKYRAPLAGVAGLGVGLGASALINKAQKARERKSMQAKLNSYRNSQSLRSTKLLKNAQGRINLRDTMPFFQLSGAKLTSAPIDPLSTFAADMFKNILDRQAMDTPFLQELAIGTYLAGTWTAVAPGLATSRYYSALVLQIGTNILNAAPGTVMNITASLPTIDGVLTVSTTPFTLTYEKGFDVRFLFFPWRLIANKAFPTLGLYNNTPGQEITITVTGIPAASAVSLIVPGTLHPWTVAMRNALLP